jgi:hypothetical protein
VRDEGWGVRPEGAKGVRPEGAKDWLVARSNWMWGGGFGMDCGVKGLELDVGWRVWSRA